MQSIINIMANKEIRKQAFFELEQETKKLNSKQGQADGWARLLDDVCTLLKPHKRAKKFPCLAKCTIRPNAINTQTSKASSAIKRKR